MQFDPKLLGSLPSTKFKAVTGTPTVGASGVDFSSSNVFGLAQYKYFTIGFWLNIPTAPAAGQVRKWGLATYGGGNNGRIEFEVSGATFQATAYDDTGTEIDTIAIPWDAAWTAAVVEYKIQWSENGIIFFVDGDKKAKMAMLQHDINVYPPKLPLSEHFRDAVADSPILDRIVYEDIRNMV
jgi:hypothetical protein